MRGVQLSMLLALPSRTWYELCLPVSSQIPQVQWGRPPHLTYSLPSPQHPGAEGVDPEHDVVKVERRGYKAANNQQPEKLGTVMVELSSTDVKGKVMRSKKILETKQNELAKLKIRNMKTKAEMNQDYFNRQVLKMIPGGEKFYIGANGALRPQQVQSGQPRQGSGTLRPSSYASAAFPRPLGPVQRLHQQQHQQPSLAPVPGLHPPAPGFFSTPPPPSTQGDNLQNFFAR